MPRGPRFNRRRGELAIVIASSVLLSFSAPAAALPPKAKGPLTPVLSELAKPRVATQAPSAQAEAVGLVPGEPAALLRDGSRVLVTARFDGGALGALADLRQAGAGIVSASPELQTVTLSVAPAALTAVAEVAGVRSVWPLRKPVLRAAGEGPCEGGSAISEGLGQLRVDEAREAFELRGKGLTVGVLSDSFDVGGDAATHAAEDVAANDLPGPASSCSEQRLPVDVMQDLASDEGTDEGRAMLQIVHDLAPHAELAFATAFESEESFAQNIEALARPVSEGGAGAEVIVDDVAWFEEPFFQDGPVAVAIDEVTDDGVTYLTAAGNDNLIDGSGRNIASWEAPAFRDSGACPTSVASLGGFNGTHCMDFDPGSETDRGFGITVQPGATLTLDLQWAEPWNGVASDLDAFLLSTGGQILTGSYANNSGPTGTQRPVEILQWENASGASRTVNLVVNRFAGLSPRLKFVLMQNGGGVSAIEYPDPSGEDVVGPSISGHAGAASAISVAAVPYDNPSAVERYSSRGPATHHFGPVDGLTPALPLGTPEEVAKPDLAATDCGATSFFAFLVGATWRFCGTSAAAPHAAAVAALVRQAKPTLPEQQVRDALTGTAVPVGAAAPEAVGAGLVDAFEAIGGLPGPIAGGDGPDQVLPTGSTTPSPPSGGGATVVANLVTMPTPAPAPTPTPPVSPPPAPDTAILRHPPKLVRTAAASARVAFRFGSDQAGVTFLCKLDRSAYRACPERLARRLRPGRHALRVKARSSAGLTDPTPASFRFRVERR
ncbi:MAG TPA: S8 family serine peptidase [Solirubrobacterales bacterium]|nr:S8 family serine peptidase [Solirubrobacterales bacterium]